MDASSSSGEDTYSSGWSPPNHGWVCPKCGAVYGPQVTECWRCNQYRYGYLQPWSPGYPQPWEQTIITWTTGDK
jgi:hypothetical protein